MIRYSNWNCFLVACNIRCNEEEFKNQLFEDFRKRSNLKLLDAIGNGCYNKGRNAYLKLDVSKISGAGRGVFSNVYFKPGDIITLYSGKYINYEPDDKQYCICVNRNTLWIDGLREPELRKGFGSFINRQERKLGVKFYKNCVFMKEKNNYYERAILVIVKAINYICPGDELYTVYGKGYRFVT